MIDIVQGPIEMAYSMPGYIRISFNPLRPWFSGLCHEKRWRIGAAPGTRAIGLAGRQVADIGRRHLQKKPWAEKKNLSLRLFKGEGLSRGQRYEAKERSAGGLVRQHRRSAQPSGARLRFTA
jgi:hypothetical protein